ncbi:MAG: substrate-binding domain-containing protein [Candidatus Lokiarchaeota archaeon]|nr:substrate-binding domain-containing protein [Candidatus Lokiarchaeota archaeon]
MSNKKSIESNSKIKRITVGCLLNRVDEEYQKIICSGISDYCKQNDLNLIYYAGRSLNEPVELESLCNFVYDLISPNSVDGLIIFSAVLGNFIKKEELLSFLKTYNSIPSVSIAMEIKDMHSLIIDDKKGMYDLIKHIIEVHNIDKIAFIKGPENNIEANQRFEAYKEILCDYNISFDPNLVIQGHFYENDGKIAVKILLDERKANFKAIVASNDTMALGALMELNNRGYNIPRDYLIVGFDNLPRSNLSNPPLTTVNQPLYNLGVVAAQSILKLIKREITPSIKKFKTELILRSSCGCVPKNIERVSIETYDNSFLSSHNKPEKKNILDKIINSLENIDIHIDKQNIENLNNALIEEIYHNQKNEFLRLLDNLILKYSQIKINPDFWHDIISEFRQNYVPLLKNQDILLIKLEDLLHKSRLLVSETEKRHYGFMNYLEHRKSRIFIHAIESFNIAHGISNLLKVIIQKISLFGIKSAYLSLFEDFNKNLFDCSKMVLYFVDNKICKVNIKSDENKFLSKNIIPTHLIPKNRRFDWIIEALRSREGKKYGFIVFEPKQDTFTNYSEISLHISIALEEAFHFEERELLLNKLELSNRELEEFAYFVSHDLKNPLHTIGGYLELLKQKYKENLEKEAIEIIDLCTKSVDKMNKLIESVLAYSKISTQTKPFTEIDINQIIKDVFFNLKNEIDISKAQITYDKLPMILGEQSQLTQLFQNLIDNAIKFQNNTNPKIHIGVQEKKKLWVFSVSDNGIGIDPINFQKIFKIFGRINTGKKYKGNGIGLAFCKKIIERHGGKIWIESKIGEGSTFFFTISK